MWNISACYPSGYQVFCDIGYQGGGGYHSTIFCVWFQNIVSCNTVIDSEKLMSKMLYLIELISLQFETMQLLIPE